MIILFVTFTSYAGLKINDPCTQLHVSYCSKNLIHDDTDWQFKHLAPMYYTRTKKSERICRTRCYTQSVWKLWKEGKKWNFQQKWITSLIREQGEKKVVLFGKKIVFLQGGNFFCVQVSLRFPRCKPKELRVWEKANFSIALKILAEKSAEKRSSFRTLK